MSQDGSAGGPSRLESLTPAQRTLLAQRLRDRAAQRGEAGAGAQDADVPTLSFAQERMWLLAELTPGMSAYNTARVVRLHGELDVDRLRAALTGVLRDHHVLRTRVRRSPDGNPVAVLAEPRAAQLELTRVGDEEGARRAVEGFISRPFDLAQDDLMRALLVEIAGGPAWLAVSLHHIASDEASRKVLWDHLDATYSGREPEQPPSQYSTFAMRQRKELAGTALAQELDWWRRHLAGSPSVAELPVDHVRPALQTYRGRRHTVPLDDELVAELRRFAAANSTTLFVAVLAAFSWLMRLWTREEDVVLGMPVSGRDDPGAEGLIGLFVNTVLVRAGCAGEPTFTELVGRTRASVLGSLAHQRVPFEKVVEAVAPARDLSRNPLFQIAVNAVTTEHELTFRLGDLVAEVVDVDPQTTKYDVGLLVRERRDGSSALVFEYSVDLFEHPTIEALADELLTLLRNGLAEPDRPLTAVSVTSPGQRLALVEQVNDTAAPIPDGCLHDAMAAQARATPDAVAVADEHGSLTFAELDRQANALAHHLRDLGVGPDVLVAVGVPRSVAMEVAVVAILKAGGAYVPLDTTYPADRLAFMLEDSGAAVLITDRATGLDLPPHPVTVLMDDLAEIVAGRPQTAPETGVTPDNLCYVIYTSGSTGRPKGAELRHRGVVNRLDWMQRTLQLTGTDTVLQKTPLSFDVSAWEVLWPVMVGARLFMARPDGHRDPAYLAEVIAREGVTVMHFVPSMLAAFLGTPSAPDVRGTRLRAVVCSGEALSYELKEQFLALLPDVELHNLYGPTEASIDVTWHRCLPGPAHRVRIGGPISNVQTYVLDESRQPVPVGVPGELYLAGVQLARGYLGRADLTADRFVSLDLAPEGRAYRTGDLVRWTSDGELDYLGRLDDQVKLRGFRIELGEIEALLASHPAVAATCAAVVTLPSGEPTLAAYVVLREDVAAELGEHETAPGAAGTDGADADDQLADWNSVWEDTYEQADGPADPRFDTRGWVSSFTGEDYSPEEMHEWVDATVDRIAGLHGAAVLEVGAGSGLLLWNLVDRTQRYVATDFSAAAVARLQRVAEDSGLDDHLVALRMGADEVSPEALATALPDGGFDVAVVNSVMQYFPDRAYAVDVVARLDRVAGADGRLFLGDIRDLRLHELFAARVETSLQRRAEGRPGAVVPAPGELRLRIEDRQLLDTELLLTPAFFAAVAGDRHVQVAPKRGRAATEMNDFRYDVVLTPGVLPREVDTWLEWSDVGSLAGLEDRLAELVASAARSGGEAGLGLRHVPNARLAPDLAVLADLGHGRVPGSTEPDAGAVHPDDLWELGERYGLTVELSVLDDPTTLAAAFTSHGAPVRFPVARSTAGPDASDPVAARRRARLRADTIRAVTDLARSRLPEYMVPAAVRALPSLPLGLSGKLDRKSLPAPFVTSGPRSTVSPRTDLERELLELWSGMLGTDDLGVEDDFFRMGGHSLLAVRMLSAVARTLEVRLPLAAVFRSPTVAGLAREVEAARSGRDLGAADDDAMLPVDRTPRRRALRRLEDPAVLAEALAGKGEPDPDADAAVFPLSRAQQRMWFLDALESGRPIYTVRRVYRVTGRVDTAVVAAALEALAARHDSLRTLTRYHGEVLAAAVVDRAWWPLEVVDLSGAPDPEAAVREHARGVAAEPFDLEAGPLATAYWYVMGDDDAVLVLRLHHVLIDGWSLDVLMEDLRVIYDALAADTTPALPEVLQYPDFVVWQETHLGDAAMERDLAYWRARLAGAPAALEIPTDHPRPHTPTSAGHRISLPLGTTLTEEIRELARNHAATPFAVLLATCSALLARLSGQDDIVVGSAVAGRQRAEVERTVGLFANTLLLRTDTSGDPRFVDLLAQAQGTVAAAQDHQDLPFEKLVEELSPERDLGRNPLFQVLLNLVPSRYDDIELGEAVLRSFDLESPFTRFDLGFTFTERPEGLVATVEYRNDLFEPATIEQLLRRLEAMLRVATTQPEIRLHELPLLTSTEERTVLEWGTNHRQAAPTSAFDLIAAQVEAEPDRVAVRAPGHPDLTYGELWRRAGVLAGRLLQEVEPGATVGLLTSRDAGLVIGALGAWRAGCSYLPLDAAHPEERRQYSLDDAGARFVITDDHLADLDGPAPAGLPQVGPGDLAYIIYTSGSTGRPKGVEIEQRSLANLLLAMAERIGFSREDRIAALTTFSFDMAVPEVFLPLVTGASVVMLEQETSTDPDALAAALESYDVTVLQGTPSRWRMLLADHWPGRPTLKALCGGEAITPDLADALRPLVGELWNCYGPTETTVWSTLGRLEEPGEVSVGSPILDTAVYVLDARGRLVPPGTSGQLWIGGGGVARGYHDRPDLTAERFVPDPWQPGRRMYATGDLAVWTSDGRLRCLGRTDNQVKLRGYRIELGEIESVISGLPGVREAAVVLREDHPGDPRIVGYVVGSTDGVWEALRASVPTYMVPSALVELGGLPRTTTNKIDRNALPAPTYDRAAGTPPGTAAELTVARVWSDLLHVESPSLEDDFFDLGGHSLLATRLASRLSEAVGAHVGLRTIFEHPTLGALAAALPAADLADGLPSGPVPVPRDGRWLDEADLTDHAALVAALDGRSGANDGEVLVWPLSAAQKRMWLLHELAPEDPRYNVSLLRRLRGSIDQAAFAGAVEALAARYDLLRATYVQVDDVLAQVVRSIERARPAFEVHDARGRAWDDVLDDVRTAAAVPFDLAHGPALRVGLTRVADDEWLLVVAMHHIALDGWSIGRVLGDLASLYAGRTLDAPALQFGDYVVWEEGREETGVDAAYWAATLAGAPEETTFPVPVERDPLAVARGRRIRRTLDPALVGRVEGLARAHRATPFMVLTAAVSALLARHGSGPDVVIGTPVATRSFAGGEELVGALINTLALRVPVDETRGFGAHLEVAAEVCRGAYAHGDYPFERLVSELKVPRSATRHPVFQVLVGLQDAPAGEAEFGEATLGTVEIDWAAVRFDAVFSWSVAPGRIELVLEYRADLFEEPLDGWLADRFETLLAAALADPTAPIGELPLLGADEAALVTSWRDSSLDGSPRSLPDLVRGVAEQDPDLPAAEVGGQVLTFAELVAAADVLAARLVQAGTGPGDVVSLVIGHHLAWPVSALAVWRIGAQFVPVDPWYPAARQQLMFEDSGSVAVVLPAGAPTPESVGDLPVVVSDPVADAALPAPALPDHTVADLDPAYLIYTSGSTGTPKAARLNHRGLAALTEAVRLRFWGGEEPRGRRVGLNSAVIFDFSVLQLVNLGFGSTLVLVPDDVRRDPSALVDFVRSSRIDVLDLTPTHLRMLLEEGLLDVTSLGRLLVGGEAVEQDLWELLRSTRFQALNLYGPTEVTVCATGADVAQSETTTIGRPLPGIRMRIVDESGRDQPVGAVGVLLLGGPQVGDGYVGRPELTAEKFPTAPDGRWYVSGDLVRARPDGNLDFFGRADDQVKIRGFRIEPGEVAKALRDRDSVADAAVVAEDGELVGYVVLAPGITWDPAGLRHDLRGELPAHLVPAVLVPVPAIPLMANGKLDRAALRSIPRSVVPTVEDRGRPPKGPAEELVAELWSELLDVAQVSAEDDFFDLGGDSLSASRFVARLRTLDIDLPLMTVFTHPTVAELAEPVTDQLLARLLDDEPDPAP